MAWRAMATGDLDAVEALAARIHPDYPEDRSVFIERLKLAPEGAFFLEIDGAPQGYLVSHPWRLGEIPPLDSLLGALPDDPDTHYIHDLALAPPARGTGAAAAIVDRLISEVSDILPTISLVAVNGSEPFWSRFGFMVEDRAGLRDKLLSYDSQARFMVRQNR